MHPASTRRLSGVVSGAGLLVKDTSNAKITLTGANLYSGDIDIGMGVLSIGANGRLAPGAYVGALDIGSGATFQYAATGIPAAVRCDQWLRLAVEGYG